MVTPATPVSSGSRLRRIMCTRPRRTSSNGIALVSQTITCGIGILTRVSESGVRIRGFLPFPNRRQAVRPRYNGYEHYADLAWTYGRGDTNARALLLLARFTPDGAGTV